MLKQGFYTAVLTAMFATTPVLADKHGADSAKHPAHQMDESVAPQGKDAGKQHGEYQWKGNKDKNKDKRYRKNQEHPAHQMDERDRLRDRGM
ncbi:hypothetical protein [Methylophaga lonarensis]|uniref:hypothetical protein n=1 Tax=Methylophaga lonarensis TaxID=999151 RepID=UPI003D2AB752